MICKYCSNEFVKTHIKRHEKSCFEMQNIRNEVIRYYTEGEPIKSLAKKYKIGRDKVMIIVADCVRNTSEAMSLHHKLHPTSGHVGYKHTEESKQKMREARLKWMKDNPEKTAWRQTSMSYPEKIFFNKMIELEFDKKYLIIRERPLQHYFIDFSFMNEKVAVEIDGSQHLLPDKKAIDDIKDGLLKQDGWRIFRVTAHDIMHNIENVFDKLSDFITGDILYERVGIHHNKEFKKYYCECGAEKNKKSKRCASCFGKSRRKVDRPDILNIMNQVDELGYTAVGRKYGVSQTTIRKWVKIKNTDTN